jgi:hypothetical protein
MTFYKNIIDYIISWFTQNHISRQIVISIHKHFFRNLIKKLSLISLKKKQSEKRKFLGLSDTKDNAFMIYYNFSHIK